MRKFIQLIALLVFPVLSFGQSLTTVTATIADPAGQAFIAGTAQADYIRPQGKQGNVPISNGAPIVEHGSALTTTLNSSGQFTISLANLSTVTPVGGTWQFTLCPNASSTCQVARSSAITGSSIDLSAALSAQIKTISVFAQPTLARAYQDPEVNLTPGIDWLDVTLNQLKFTDALDIIHIIGGGGGGGTPCVLQPFTLQLNNAGAFGCVPNTTPPSPVVSTGLNNTPISLLGVTYASPNLNWQRVVTTNFTAATPTTLTLSSCPAGNDTTSTVGYQAYILDGASSEAVSVTGGTCTVAGGSAGTMLFTPFFSHTSGASSLTGFALHNVPDGTGYQTGDVLTVAQGGASGGQITVTQVNASLAITGAIITAYGTGYALASNLNLSGGHGTGATVDVTSVGGFLISSATAGIQEAANLCGGTGSFTFTNVQCHLVIPANGPYVSGGSFAYHSYHEYDFYGTLFLHSVQSLFDGYGASVNCRGRQACIQIGNLTNASNYTDTTIAGLALRAPTDFSAIPAYAGVKITHANITTNVATITTLTPHGFRTGEMVTKLFTDNKVFWGDSVITSVPSSTTFTYALLNANLDVDTPGVVALTYVGFLDNANNTHYIDTSIDPGNALGKFNNFFDIWDDENATITKFDNHGAAMNASINWSGSNVFAACNVGHTVGPLITIRDSTITGNNANGITNFCSNGTLVDHTVVQAVGPWQFNISNETGGFVGGTLRNIYSENSATNNGFGSISGTTVGTFIVGELITQATTGSTSWVMNAATGATALVVSMYRTAIPDATHTWTGADSGAVFTPTTIPTYKSPFAGLGTAGLIAGNSSGVAEFEVTGVQNPIGNFISAGTTGTSLSYYIVAKDTTATTQTSPMQAMTWNSTGTDKPKVQWPRMANVGNNITYDVLRMTTAVNVGDQYPSNGNCPGGAGGICGSVATNLSQATACAGGLVCEFTDDASVSSSAYTVLKGNWAAQVVFWPGSLVSVNRTIVTEHAVGSLVGLGLSGNAIQRTSNCPVITPTGPGGYTACFGSSNTPSNSIFNQSASLLSDGPSSGGSMTFTKGRLNFATTPYALISAHHFITLQDCNPGLTQASTNLRPLASTCDTYLGTDTSVNAALNLGQLSIGAQISITNYIANAGDGVNFLERLTANQKDFRVPTLFEASMFASAGCVGCSPFSLSGAQVSDNFNRANGALGANWTTTAGTFAIVSNQATVTAVATNIALAAYTGTTFANNQYAQVQWLGGGGWGGALCIRCSNSAITGYVLSGVSGTASILYKFVAGTSTVLASGGPAFTLNDVIRLEAVGTAITAYKNGTVILTATDSSITSGYPGIGGINFVGGILDGFYGGNLSWTSSATIQMANLAATSLICTDGSSNLTTTGCPGGGGGSVTSVFGRVGIITAASGDYNISQITGAPTSVFGRTGTVVATTGDYTVGQITGAAPLVSPSFTTPSLGVATATSLLASGIVDGLAPVTVTTTATATLGGTNKTGYVYNQEATSTTAITYTLPTAAQGRQYCIKNSNNGTSAETGTLKLVTSASGQFIIYNGVLSASGGYIISTGAAGDGLCITGVDTTHWEAYVQNGTWTLH